MGPIMQTKRVSPFSAYGYPVEVGLPMPRVPESTLDIAVYLYHDAIKAEAGSELGGSGFLFAVDCKRLPGKSHALVVTNRHVIEDGATVVRLNNKDGSTSIWDFTERDWTFHSDGTDLAIAFAPVTSDMRYKGVGLEDFVSREKHYAYGIGAGDETLLIGRYVGADGTQINKPTVRFGTIAQNGTTVFSDPRGRAQESFLIEGKSIGGFSGSAVYVYRTPSFGQGERAAWPPMLLGIDWSHPSYREPLRDVSGRPSQQGLYVDANSGFMAVIPAWKITEITMTPEIAAIMDEREHRVLQSSDPA